MHFPVPTSLQRLLDQVDGWLDLRCPERALELVDPLLANYESRPAGLALRIRANARLGNIAAALEDLADLRSAPGVEPPLGNPLNDHATSNEDWIDLTEAWCRRRNQDLPGAIRCAQQLLTRNHRHHIARFNLACYLALNGECDRAIDELSVACGIAPECRTLAIDEPDFDSLRRDARFRQLLRPVTPEQDLDVGPGPK